MHVDAGAALLDPVDVAVGIGARATASRNLDAAIAARRREVEHAGAERQLVAALVPGEVGAAAFLRCVEDVLEARRPCFIEAMRAPVGAAEEEVEAGAVD